MPIVKSTTIKNASQAQRNVLEYVLRAKDQFIDKNGKSLFIKHNVLGKADDLDFLTKQFLDNLQYRIHKRSNNISILHDIISFHPSDRDKIDTEILKEIALKYIQERNPLGMYIIASHSDAEHLHLHIVASALEFSSGKSMRMSQEAFSNLQNTINEFQKKHYPELDHSVVEYKKDQVKKKKLDSLQQIRNIRLRNG